MKRCLHILLLISFLLTLLVPLTGLHIHKSASLLFLLLSLVHTGFYRSKMDARRFAVLGAILASFVTGLLGQLFQEAPIILALHKVISIAVVFFLAIHIFVFLSKLSPRRR